MTRDHDAALVRTSLLQVLALGLVLAPAGGCVAGDDAVAWRIDPEVLPFIPICTACFMTGGADRAAVHRRSTTLLDAAADTDAAADAAGDTDAADRAGLDPLRVIAVRHPSGPWMTTDTAHVTEPAGFRVYAWSSADKSAEASDDAAWLEPIEDAVRSRIVQFLVVDGEVSAVCDVPWFPGAKFPDDLAGFVADQQIPDTRCAPLE